MLVRVAGAGDRAGVQPCFVGERGRAHVGLLRIERHVHHLGDVVGDRREPFEALLGDRTHAHLQRQVRDGRREVAVARAFAVAVDRALHVGGAAPYARERVGDAAAGVVVGVHADPHVVAEVAHDLGHDGLDLVRERAAVGVAEHQRARALLDGRLEHAQAELGVALVAVEEVLGVEEHPKTGVAQELDGVVGHGHALVEGGLERVAHVVVPAFPDDAHGGRARLDEVPQGVVGVDLAELPARGSEGDERARVEGELGAGAAEELVVLRVGARPAALDEVDAEPVELLGDPQLVLDGERQPLELAAVAQRRVVDLDRLRERYRVRCGHARANPCSGRPGRAPPRSRSPGCCGKWGPARRSRGRRPSGWERPRRQCR